MRQSDHQTGEDAATGRDLSLRTIERRLQLLHQAETAKKCAACRNPHSYLLVALRSESNKELTTLTTWAAAWYACW